MTKRTTSSRKRGMKNPGVTFQTKIDAITNTSPTIKQGVYTVQGNQMSVMNHLNHVTGTTQMMMFQPQQQVYENPLQVYQPPVIGFNPTQIAMAVTPPVIQANITVVGNKTSSAGSCCFILTSCFGCLIFPLLFMCCMWWKRIVFPKYQVNPEFYRSLGRFLRKEMQCRVLNLTVVDNSFDTEKARLLYEALSGTSITGLKFKNSALPCNHMRNQADDFQGNMMTIKGLPITSNIQWGKMVL